MGVNVGRVTALSKVLSRRNVMGGPSQKGHMAQSCPIVSLGKVLKPLGAGFGSMGFFYKGSSLKFLLPKPGMSTLQRASTMWLSNIILKMLDPEAENYTLPPELLLPGLDYDWFKWLSWRRVNRSRQCK